METTSLLQQAFQLRKEKKPEAAIAVYEPIWHNEPKAFGAWEGWSYGQCLRELRRYTDALEVCRTLYRRQIKNDMLDQLYAWCIYYTQLAGDQQPANYALYKKAVEAILQLSPPANPYSPAVRSVFKIIKYLGGQININWPEMERWLNLLDVGRLTQDTYTVDIPGKRKPVEMAGDMEEWYSWKSKCLIQQQKWEECIQLCDAAAGNISKWHYSNDIWFSRRKAACLAKLGHRAEAEIILRQLLQRRREWFMLADLGELCQSRAEALQLYAEAALAYGEPEKKLRLYQLMAAEYLLQQNTGMAQKHLLLILALRRQNNWPIPVDIAGMLQQAGGVPEPLPGTQHLLSSLQNEWKAKTGGDNKPPAKEKRYTGVIEKLLPNGAAGFIKPDAGGDSIYFLFKNYRGDTGLLKPGKKVSFETTESYDTRRQKASKAAVRIKPV
jgi:cold shock CspA family protein